MKNALLSALTALAICFALPVLIPNSAEGEKLPTDRPARVLPIPTASPQPSASPAPEYIDVLIGGESVEMPLEEYLIGVVASEMPASFETEALKAQAVAARTYTLYCAASNKHGSAEVCTDYACCQAWKDEAAMRSDWGAEYDTYYNRIAGAVLSTEGEYLTYGGEAIFAAFHSSSAGMTERSAEIWSELPYLISVPSPENAENVPNYVSSVAVLGIDFRDTLLSAHPELDLSGSEDAWIGETERDDSGRVRTVRIGGGLIGGTELRSLFSLRSTAFELSYAEGVFTFTVTGYGHGVGMSQYGANAMARSGSSYGEILEHYYPGTVAVRSGAGG